MPRRWIKLYCDECLEGSIRVDLDPSERSIWIDLLLLAGKSRREGYIERSKGIPYTLTELVHKLQVSDDQLLSTIRKCIAEGRIVDIDGTLYISNWSKYQDSKDVKEKKQSYMKDLNERQKTSVFANKHPDVAHKALEDLWGKDYQKKEKTDVDETTTISQCRPSINQ